MFIMETWTSFLFMWSSLTQVSLTWVLWNRQMFLMWKGKGEEDGVSLKKRTSNWKISPALSFYGNFLSTYAQTTLVFLVKVNKTFILVMGQYLTWCLNYLEFSLSGFSEQGMCCIVRCLNRTHLLCTETKGLL